LELTYPTVKFVRSTTKQNIANDGSQNRKKIKHVIFQPTNICQF
jgi:hypothetical protein